MKREKTVIDVEVSEEKQREIVSSLLREHTNVGMKFERERTRQEEMVSPFNLGPVGTTPEKFDLFSTNTTPEKFKNATFRKQIINVTPSFPFIPRKLAPAWRERCSISSSLQYRRSCKS